ncbi:MAG: acyl carrier protein [Acidobacteriota bacterium]
MKEARDHIRQFIQGHLVVFDDEAVFSDSDNIFEKGFVNSLFAMQLVTYVQQAFGLELSDDDIDLANFRSIDAMINLLTRKHVSGP